MSASIRYVSDGPEWLIGVTAEFLIAAFCALLKIVFWPLTFSLNSLFDASANNPGTLDFLSSFWQCILFVTLAKTLVFFSGLEAAVSVFQWDEFRVKVMAIGAVFSQWAVPNG
jgi:hypothetical protein